MERAHSIADVKINIFWGQLLFALRKQIPAIIGIKIIPNKIEANSGKNEKRIVFADLLIFPRTNPPNRFAG